MLKSFAAYSLSATIKKEATAAAERGLLPSPSPPQPLSVSAAVLVSLSLQALAEFVWPQKFLHTVNTEGIIPH